MSLHQIFKFLGAAAGFIDPEIDPDKDIFDLADESRQIATRYHYRIVIVATSFGLLAATFAGACIWSQPNLGREGLKVILLGPVVLGIAGILEGIALMCAFAPHEFLTGSLGQKWMDLIGTKNVTVARIVCGTLASLPVILGIAAGLVIAIKG